MKSDRESALYPIVRKWLEKSHLCFKTEEDTGVKYSRIDVIGIKDVDGELSGEVETIAVEVKKGTEPFAKASGQALAYKVYANRIYLADQRDTPFIPDEIQIASHLGIGLIQIQNKKCNEVLSSPYYKPIEKLNLILLENLALGKCQLCDSFFKIVVARENIKKAITDEKGLKFWNRAVDDRKREVGISKAKADETRERRYICPDCMHYFF